MTKNNAHAGVQPARAKSYILGAATAFLLIVGSSAPAFAAPPANPGSYGTAAPNAQCGTSAVSGAFNAHNSIYGPNSSSFGQSGGAGGGQAGLNNSVVCGNPQS